MRQHLSQKTARRYAMQAGLHGIVTGFVRGSTGHRVDLCTDTGYTWSYWPSTGVVQSQSTRYHWANIQSALKHPWGCTHAEDVAVGEAKEGSGNGFSS